MYKTKIEWCDSTWNPVTGCLHGCEYCYARKIATRYKCKSVLKIGKNVEAFELDEPFDSGSKKEPYPFGFKPTLHRYRIGDYANKKGRTIFVCSMADLFGEWVPDTWIMEVFKACEKAPQHRYLFLTKNPRRYHKLAHDGKLPTANNMWFGSTVTIPDKPFFFGEFWNTFISIEPIMCGGFSRKINPSTNWVIIGAETGNRKDKVIPDKAWIDDIVRSYDENKIPVFMKDSLIPIVGEENMLREFPWEVQNEINK